MARIFITGSSDGLGLFTATKLLQLGHQVVLHARNELRGQQALEKAKGAQQAVYGDLASMQQTKDLAGRVNALGPFDVIIHNAGIYNTGGNSEDGIPLLFAVNSLAPYLLTCFIQKPKRLIYISSDMHLTADRTLGNLHKRTLNSIGYSDTKFHNVLLSMAVAKRWEDVYTNALHPGWVPTKMGGPGAPDNLQKGYETQVWLATSDEKEAMQSGKYFYHKKPSPVLPEAENEDLQEKYLNFCEQLTGVTLQN